MTKNIVIAGNPNSGKSTLFNRLTNFKQKVANYAGVTVEHFTSVFKYDKSLQVIDVPGLYSLESEAEDAKIAQTFILKQQTMLLIVVNSTNLSRQLLLPLQLKQLGIPFVLVLNMEDELKARGGSIDKDKLKIALGIPVFAISALIGWGMSDLIRYLRQTPHQTPQIATHQNKDSNQQSTHSLIKQGIQIEKDVLLRPLGANTLSEKLDSILLHRFYGLIFLVAMLAIIFQVIFSWAVPLMDGIENAFIGLSNWIESALPQVGFGAVLKEVLTEGIIAGVGSVLVFVPQIAILAIILGLLEQTGYMARASFVMDRLMQMIGLEGKSFLPLLVGNACAIPAIMATRHIENKMERLTTIFIIPFMTCSARLPVYILIITAFVPNISYAAGFIHLRSLVMLSLYLISIVFASLTAWIIKLFIKSNSDTLSFMQEMPPYRLPFKLFGVGTWNKAFYFNVWHSVRRFIIKAGKIILLTSILLWFLSSYPKAKDGYMQESYAFKIGKIIEPIIAPLGFDWRIGVGLITSLVAREVVVSSLATLYNVENTTEEPIALTKALQAEISPPQAFSLLIFFVFALQCLATLAVAKRETNSYWLPLGMFTYMFVLAYLSSFVVYQLSLLIF